MSRIFLTVAAAATALAFAGSDFVLAQTPPATGQETPAAAPTTGKKKAAKKSARQEADESVKSGTVPKRYMQNVPKEYHHLIPFSK